MAFDPVSAILGLGDTLIKRVWPDPEQQAKAQIELLKLNQEGALSEMIQAAGIIASEAKSEHWLTSTWRPITMLCFLAMLMAYWFDVMPEAAVARITPAMFQEFVELLKIGIGGYVGMRGGEKMLKIWKQGKE